MPAMAAISASCSSLSTIATNRSRGRRTPPREPPECPPRNDRRRSPGGLRQVRICRDDKPAISITVLRCGFAAHPTAVLYLVNPHDPRAADSIEFKNCGSNELFPRDGCADRQHGRSRDAGGGSGAAGVSPVGRVCRKHRVCPTYILCHFVNSSCPIIAFRTSQD